MKSEEVKISPISLLLVGFAVVAICVSGSPKKEAAPVKTENVPSHKVTASHIEEATPKPLPGRHSPKTVFRSRS